MKAKALAKCEVTDANKPKRHWRDDPALMTFLRALALDTRLNGTVAVKVSTEQVSYEI